MTTLVPFIFEPNPWDIHKTYVGIHPGYVSTLLCVLRIQSLNMNGEKEEVGASSHAPSGQNLADSVGNLRGFWLLVEGIHAEIWVVSETRIHVEIQGKFLNRS